MRGYYPGEGKPRPRRGRAEPAVAGAPGAIVPAADRKSSSRRIDWVIGILLGVVLGICVIVAFLVFGSAGTIDAPRIHGGENGKPPAQSRPAEEVRESR